MDRGSTAAGKKGPFTNECKTCEEEFEAAVPNAMYCPKHRDSRGTEGVFSHLPQKYRGTASELHAVLDLWERGYEVYRNVAPHGSVDLIAYGENHDLLRIEVTSGRKSEDGSLYYPPHHEHENRRDLICVIPPGREVLYFDTEGNPILPDGRRMTRLDLDVPHQQPIPAKTKERSVSSPRPRPDVRFHFNAELDEF